MPSTVSEVWVQPPFGEVDYRIGVYNSTFYYAQNVSTGELEFLGSDAGFLIYTLTVGGPLMNGGVILVKDGVFHTSIMVLLPSNTTLLFSNANWTINAHAVDAVADFYCFGIINGATNVYIDFANSWIDCNIANQTPTLSTHYIFGLWFWNNTHITIPHFQGTGFGSNKCYGFAVSFYNCSDVTIGSVIASDCGSDALALQGCKNVQVESVSGSDLSLVDSYGAGITIFTYESWQTTSNVQIGKVAVINSRLALRIGADNGTTRDVTVGEVIGINVQDTISIDSSMNTSAVGYDFIISSIIGENVDRWGFRVASNTYNNVHNVKIGSVIIHGNRTSGASYGCDLLNVTNVQIDSMQVFDLGDIGLLIDKCAGVQIGKVLGENVTNHLAVISESTNVQIDSVNGHLISTNSSYCAVVYVGNFHENTVTQNVQIGNIIGNDTKLLLRVNGDWGTTRQIAVNSIAGINVYDAVAIEQSNATTIGTAHDISIGQIQAYNVSRIGVRVGAMSLGKIYNVDFGSVEVNANLSSTDGSAFGYNLYYADYVTVQSLTARYFYADGVAFTSSQHSKVAAKIFNCNCGSGVGESGIRIFDSSNNVFYAEEVIDNRTPALHYYGFQEQGSCDNNSWTIGYVSGWINKIGGILGVHSQIYGPQFNNWGLSAGAVNGTAIAHSLSGTPTSITISISGTQYMNSTCWLLTPTVIALNSTHFIVSMVIFNAGTISAVTATNARDIMWDCYYTPAP